MICYKDMTYCTDAPQCNNKDCHRRLIDDDIQAAKKLNLWIAQSSFIPFCTLYKPADK